MFHDGNSTNYVSTTPMMRRTKFSLLIRIQDELLFNMTTGSIQPPISSYTFGDSSHEKEIPHTPVLHEVVQHPALGNNEHSVRETLNGDSIADTPSSAYRMEASKAPQPLPPSKSASPALSNQPPHYFHTSDSSSANPPIHDAQSSSTNPHALHSSPPSLSLNPGYSYNTSNSSLTNFAGQEQYSLAM